jgi:uncharacterized protein YkwD
MRLFPVLVSCHCGGGSGRRRTPDRTHLRVGRGRLRLVLALLALTAVAAVSAAATRPVPEWYTAWANWRTGQAVFTGHGCDPRVRPAAAPKHIPAWAWTRLRTQIAAAHERAPALNAQEHALLDAVNAFRASKNLSRLVVSDALERAARERTANMAANNYWSHVFVKGGVPYLFSTWFWWYARGLARGGENLACGWQTVDITMQKWIASPHHYANLIEPRWRLVGIAVGGSTSGVGYPCGPIWTIDFGA